MKTVDIHTGELAENINRLPIDRELIKFKTSILVDFKISDFHLDIIDELFAEYCNNKIGVGGYYYEDDISVFISQELNRKRIVIPFEMVDGVVKMILFLINKHTELTNKQL